MKFTNTKGFTLIELLVVIAIIGILSSIVLASLNSARDKGANAAVKADLQGVRSQAEITYDNDNQSYANVCSNSNIVNALTHALTVGGDANVGGTVANRCNNTASAWAINALLKTPEGANNYWCVDSAGKGKGEANELASATVCS